MSRETDDLKEAIRLKCQNDWGLELTNDQVDLCIITMEREKISLFHGQIWPNSRSYKDQYKNWQKRVTWDKTIDGFRAQAHRHGLAGADAPVFVTGDDGTPVMASVTVYRSSPTSDLRDSYIGVARFSEFATKQDEYGSDGKRTGKKVLQRQWRESPFNQLAIAAEKQALRKGFQEMFGAEEDVEVVDDPIESDTMDTAQPDPPESEKVADKPPEKPAETKPAESKPKPEEITPSEAVSPLLNMRGQNFTGSKVLSVDVREDGTAVIELESGFKVLIDKDGKELKRKPLEKVDDPSPPPPSEAPHEGPRSSNPEELLAAAKEGARSLMGRWCNEKNDGVKISPKAAYEKLLGVVVGSGQKMSADDYVALREQLEEELAGKETG